MNDISIIIVNYNGTGLIETCLGSIKENLINREREISCEVIIIDNASSDSSPGFLDKFCRENKDFKLIKNNSNLGFGTASNIGAGKAGGEFLLFLNPDCRILDEGMSGLLDFYREKKDSGVLGAGILNRDSSLQLSCRAFQLSTVMARAVSDAYAVLYSRL